MLFADDRGTSAWPKTRRARIATGLLRLFVAVESLVLLTLCPPVLSHAQQPYVRTWDKGSNEQLQVCNNLATYNFYGRDNMDSLCRTVKQQDEHHCKEIKGYPDYTETLKECKRLGK